MRLLKRSVSLLLALGFAAIIQASTIAPPDCNMMVTSVQVGQNIVYQFTCPPAGTCSTGVCESVSYTSGGSTFAQCACDSMTGVASCIAEAKFGGGGTSWECIQAACPTPCHTLAPGVYGSATYLCEC